MYPSNSKVIPLLSRTESWEYLWYITVIHMMSHIWLIVGTNSCGIILAVFIFALFIVCFFVAGIFFVLWVWFFFINYIATDCGRFSCSLYSSCSMSLFIFSYYSWCFCGGELLLSAFTSAIMGSWLWPYWDSSSSELMVLVHWYYWE